MTWTTLNQAHLCGEAIVSSNDEPTADKPQRIDLTQFEGMSEGKWEHDGGEIHAEEAGRNNSIIAQYPSWNYNVINNDGLLTVEDHCNLIAMAAVPDLIAELKRTYDKIDVLEERLQFSEHIMETMHDEHYADLVMDFIEEAHPSKWCDWGHCRKCQRLKNE